MSSSGIKKLRTSQDRVTDVLREQEQDFIQNLKPLGSEKGGFGLVGLGGTTSGSPIPAGNYLNTAGGTMIGPVAYYPTTVSIASNVIDISLSSEKSSTYVILDSATTDLITITGAQFSGQDLILQGKTGSTITVKNSGNIVTSDGADYDIVGLAIIRLIYDEASTKWRVYSTGGSGGVSYPLTPPVNVVGSVASGTTTIDLSTSNAHSTTLTATGNSTLAFSNYPSSGNQMEWEVQITQDSTGGRIITMPSEVVEDPGIITTADSISVIVFRTNDGGTTVHVVSLLNASPTTASGANKELDNLTTTALNTDLHLNTFDIDEVDRLVFDKSAGNALGATDTGITSDAGGSMEFNLSGTSNSYDFLMNDDGVIRLQINNNTVVSQSLFPVSSSSDTLGSSGVEWFSGHILTMTNTTANITTGNITNIVSGGAGYGMTSIGHLDFVNNLATPTAALSLYTDGTDIFANTGGSVKNLSNIGSGAGANQQLSNLSGTVSVNMDLLPNQATGGNLGSATAGSEWFNLFSRRVTFAASTSLGSTDYTFGRVASPLRVEYNVPTGAVHRFTINGTREMELTDTELILAGVNLDMENNSITDTNQLQITGTTGDIVLGYLSGTTGYFNIVSNENDSSINLYARRSSGTLEKLLEVNGNTGGVVVGTGVVSLLTFGDSGNPSQITRLNDDMTFNATGHLELDIGGVTKLDITATDIIVNEDLDIATGNYLDLPDTSTVASGTAIQLPLNGSSNAACEGFIKIKVNGAIKKLPYYS